MPVPADGSNRALLEKLEWAKQQRAKGLPTVPSTIGVRPRPAAHTKQRIQHWVMRGDVVLLFDCDASGRPDALSWVGS